MNGSSRENSMLQILKFWDAFSLFMFLIINERNSKQSHAKQCSLAILMVLKDANSMIQFQANHRSRDVVFLDGKFHEFGTEHSTDSFHDYTQSDVQVPRSPIKENRNDGVDQNVPVDPQEQDVAVDHRPDERQVGATYEDNFLREVEQLGERQCKPLARFDEECYISSNL